MAAASETDASGKAERKVIKAAKKTLKRQDSKSMKIKSLAKSVLETSSDGSIPNCKKTVVRWISEAQHVFEVDGKHVSLKSKKRKSNDNNVNDIDNDNETSQEKHDNNPTSVERWRKTHKIVLKDSRDGSEATDLLGKHSLYFPFRTFDSCSDELNPALIRQCTEVNQFRTPSPIQAQCWPILLHSENGRHRDVVGIAETGSGKTLAFAMPALSILSNTSNKHLRMLVLAPTRELAMQSHGVLSEFGSVVQLTSAVIYGGVPKPPQREILRRGVDCLVCTPGRLKDLLSEGSCHLGEITHLVLDEADRMLDMGFEEDVRHIISKCPEKEFRQTAMFSATWPAAIRALAMEFTVDPVCIYVGFESIAGSNGENEVDDSLSANRRVVQRVEVVEDRAREGRLKELLDKFTGGGKRSDRVLVFALYKKEAARLEGTVGRWGYRCGSIHGDKAQDARNRALQEFKDGTSPILVATDVAARGLDIPDVEVVINYTFPLTIEDYVHRIGRTGRAGKTGISHTFFQPGDKGHAGELQAVMKQAGQEVPEELMRFGSTIKKKEHKLYGNFGPKDGPMKKAVKITFSD